MSRSSMKRASLLWGSVTLVVLTLGVVLGIQRGGLHALPTTASVVLEDRAERLQVRRTPPGSDGDAGRTSVHEGQRPAKPIIPEEQRGLELIGVLVTHAGEPLRQKDVEVGVKGDGLEETKRIVRTDTSGRFEVLVGEAALACRTLDMMFMPFFRADRAIVEFDVGGRTLVDLGVVRLNRTDLLGRGYVVGGKAFLDHWQQVKPKLWVEHFVPEAGRWSPLPRVEFSIEHDGAFSIYGTTRNERLRIVNRDSRLHLESSSEFALGSGGIIVSLSPSVFHRVTIRTASSFETARLRVYLVDGNGKQFSGIPVGHEVLESKNVKVSRYVVQSLARGTYGIKVASAGRDIDFGEVHVIDGTQAASDLDLQSKYGASSLSLMDEFGQAVGADTLIITLMPDKEAWRGFLGRGPVIDTSIVGTPCTISIMAKGYAPSVTTLAPGRNIVSLRSLKKREILVRLKSDGTPPDGYWLSLSVWPRGESLERSVLLTHQSGDQRVRVRDYWEGEATLTKRSESLWSCEVVESMMYDVRLTLVEDVPRGKRPAAERIVETALTPSGTESGDEFIVAIDQERIESALERLKSGRRDVPLQ